MQKKLLVETELLHITMSVMYVKGTNIYFSGCSFLTKTINAENAGALAAIIFDHQQDNDESMIDMIQDETQRTTGIPSFFLLGKDG